MDIDVFSSPLICHWQLGTVSSSGWNGMASWRVELGCGWELFAFQFTCELV